VPTKSDCNNLMISDKIKQEVQIIHGEINQRQREATIEAFKKGKVKCLIATDVASRGLDIPMVDLVIQSEPPKEVDIYIHRAGRTARAGKTGTCITLYTKRTEDLIARIEREAKINLKKIGAPQTIDLINSSIRDITHSIIDIDESSINLFKNESNNLISTYGAEEALARLLAYVSGHTEKMKARSLICGAEGFITYRINSLGSAFRASSYIWSILRRVVSQDLLNRIKGMRCLQSMEGAIFDFPEENKDEFEKAVYSDKSYGTNYEMVVCDVLPELVEVGLNNGYGGGNNGYGGGSNGYGGGDSRRRIKFDVFVGNLPFNATEGDILDLIKKQNIDTSDVQVRLVTDERGEIKGFGFISFYNEELQKKFLKLQGRLSFKGRSLRIDDANNKPNK